MLPPICCAYKLKDTLTIVSSSLMNTNNLALQKIMTNEVHNIIQLLAKGFVFTFITLLIIQTSPVTKLALDKITIAESTVIVYNKLNPSMC